MGNRKIKAAKMMSSGQGIRFQFFRCEGILRIL